MSFRIWIPLEFSLKYEHAFPWDQAQLAQARLLPPVSMPGLQVPPHLQRLQTSRMFWDRVWKRIISSLTVFLRPFFISLTLNVRNIFPTSKGKKYPHGCPKEKKPKQKNPPLIFYWRISKGKLLLCFCVMLLAKRGQVSPSSRAGTKVLLTGGWAPSPGSERSCQSFVHLLGSRSSLPVK